MDPALAAEMVALSRQKALKEALQRGDSEVSAFFKDKVVFITGASGFLGKQLVEKIFRCTDVRKIYLLLRGKKGKSIYERLQQILKDPVYSGLHKEKPEFVKKIAPVEGDVAQLRIGLTDDDWELLSSEVNVIFHVAATVSFEEPLRAATLTNVRGTREVLALARDCKRLYSVVHVSTAFAHATKSRVRGPVAEAFYPSPVAPEQLIRLAETNDLRRLGEVQKLGSEWPNTYTFTKAVAEEVVRTAGGDLPVCIVRPAIVVGAFREPSPGWVDEHNLYGASGLILGISMGVIHTMMTDPSSNVDLVPVDAVSSALLAAARRTAAPAHTALRPPRVYTLSNTRNTGTAEKLISVLETDVRALVSPQTVWYCGGVHTRHRAVFLALACLLHYIPALVADAALLLLGKKTRFIKIYKKVGVLCTVLTYFLTNCWHFHDENTLDLFKQLSPTDRDLYNFDMASVDFKELIIIWHLGIRKYIVKDGLRDTQYGVYKQKWLRLLNYVVFPIYLYGLFKIFSLMCSVLLLAVR